MVYRQVSSKRLIGDMFDRFNIDYSGFISRVPNWIHKAMGELDMYQSLLDEALEVEVSEFKAVLPADCYLLLGISYLGTRLTRTDIINQKTNDYLDSLVASQYSYELNNNGYIITTLEECDAEDFIFYYKKLPVELDSTTSLYFPLIPDNSDLIVALEWYILRSLLERGHKIREYSLTANNLYINPAMAWDKYSKVAKNSVSSLDLDEREELSTQIRTFLTDRNYHMGGSFNNQNIQP